MTLRPPAGEAHDERVEVAEILRRARDEGHIDTHGLTRDRAKVLHQICACRTAQLGGHADVCMDCGVVSYSYNSCRNRHCPRCQWSQQQEWIAGRIDRLLDTHYFHVVFTLPAELRTLAMRNQRLLYTLLFRAASRTLLELGEERLGATIGITAVLHTWARDLTFHPHIHCIVTGGGLSADCARWRSAHPNYLFPQVQVSKRFRAKFLAGLHKLFDNDDLEGITASELDALVGCLPRDWGVYLERSRGGPETVIKYLGAYTHRVAISDSRIVRVTSTHVTFATRDGETVTVSIGEFARRFLLHVLPPRFMKIRHYGLLASANSKTKWVLAHQLRPYTSESSDEPEAGDANLEPAQPTCEVCGSHRVWRMHLQPWPTSIKPLPARGPPAQLQLGGTR